MFGASPDSGTLPPLPKIEGDVDLMLEVYTHPSLRNSSVMNEDYGDTSRLAELGSKALELAVTYHLYSEKPFIDSEKIRERRLTILGDNNIIEWLTAYGLKAKLRISPTDQAILEDPEQMRRYFHTYIGALYIRNGYPAIQAWISQLIDPSVEVKLPDPSPPVEQHQAPVYQAQYPSQPYVGGYAAHQPQFPMYAPPPTLPPPPLPTAPPTFAASNASLVTLALVNQTAAQRGYTVTYPAVQEGPPHQPTWTVRCCMNGKESGIGVGKSQKIAKEAAARQAWTTMGWGPS